MMAIADEFTTFSNFITNVWAKHSMDSIIILCTFWSSVYKNFQVVICYWIMQDL